MWATPTSIINTRSRGRVIITLFIPRRPAVLSSGGKPLCLNNVDLQPMKVDYKLMQGCNYSRAVIMVLIKIEYDGDAKSAPDPSVKTRM